ncbi:hypothetical protein D3C85_1379150 [compost metagenome]
MNDHFMELNGEGIAFPPQIEGYWRQYAVPPFSDRPFPMAADKYPWPVPMESEGFHKEGFLRQLRFIQDQAQCVTYRGFSRHRLSGGMNGSAEYEHEGWKWPEGYASYVEMGVPPSQAFYEFVMGLPLLTLPTYGRK